MFDLNAIVSAALNAAVQQAIAPLVERIANLDAICQTQHEAMVAMRDRIAVLENNPAQGVDSTLERRIAALESETQGENRYLNRDDVAELIAEAMDEHNSNYDHDAYDSHISDDDKHFETDFEDALNRALRNASIEIRI